MYCTQARTLYVVIIQARPVATCPLLALLSAQLCMALAVVLSVLWMNERSGITHRGRTWHWEGAGEGGHCCLVEELTIFVLKDHICDLETSLGKSGT